MAALAASFALVLLIGAGPAWAASLPRLSPPIVRFVPGGAATTKSVPVTIRWAPAPGSGSISRYRLRVTRSGGPWRDIQLDSPRSRSAGYRLAFGAAYRFAVTATGPAGSTTRVSLPVKAELLNERTPGIAYRGRWTTATNAGYLGGHVRTTVEPGASAIWTGSALGVAIVATRGPGRGIGDVWLDGSTTGSVRLTATRNAYRRVVAVESFTTESVHAVGLAAHGGPIPRIDLDGVVVLRSVAPTPLIAVGDVADCESDGDEQTASLAGNLSGPIALIGDLAYPTGSAADFGDCFNPSWGPLMSRVHPVPGNHEYLTPDAADYFAYFGSRAGVAGQGWYAYRVGSWDVYALNSNCAEIGGCGPKSTQYRWLKSALAAHPRACLLAYWHHPRFSSGAHGSGASMASLWSLLAAHGADVVVAGHDHDYERLAPSNPAGQPAVDGIRGFVAGTGGAALRPFTRAPLEITQFRQDTRWGLLSLSLGLGSYGWQFIEADSGAVLDAGTSRCH